MSRIDLDKVIGMCRLCDKPLGESPPPACYECTTVGNQRPTRIRESDPYKKVWNIVEDEEKYLSTMAANNTLFVPTAEDMARRHIGTAKYLLAEARHYGQTNLEHGQEIFEEALVHVRLAKKFKEINNTILERGR